MKYLPPSIEHLAARLFTVERRHGSERQDSVCLDRRRIYILPTYFGFLYSLLLMTLLIGSTNYNNSLGFILTFLLASIGLVSIVHTYRNLHHLRLRGGRVEPVFCGSAARFPLRLDSDERYPRYNLRLRFKGKETAITDLEAEGSSEVKLSLATERRGWRQLERVTIDTVFPLGLFRAWSHFTLPQRCLVYPPPADQPLLPPPRSTNGSGSNRQQPGNDDFVGFRDYQPGDSPRHINWKGAARSDELLTKLFGDNESNELWFEWEQLPGLDTESKLSRLCRWVIDAEQGEARYGLRIPGETIPLGQGQSHRHRCLEALALFDQE